MERVYVENLPQDICIKDLDDFFRPFGNLVHIGVHNECKPVFAYVQFDNECNAHKAVCARNGYDYEGHTLHLKLVSNKTTPSSSVLNESDPCGLKIMRIDAAVESDSDLAILKDDPASSGVPTPRVERTKKSKEGIKAFGEYKSAIKVHHRLKSAANLSAAQRDLLVWAVMTMEKGRAHFANNPRFTAKNPLYPNSIEECVIKSMSEKRQLSVDKSSSSDTKTKKRTHQQDDEKPSTSNVLSPNLSKVAKASEVEKSSLCVALVDMSNGFGQMTSEQWKIVETKLINELIAKMEAEPNQPLPSFDESSWFNRVKLLKCIDELSLEWITKAVPKLKDLWTGAKLKIVNRANIPGMPLAMVKFPRVAKPEISLRLLQKLNPDIPTREWKVLHVDKPDKDGQIYILQITPEAEDLLYSRYGKMYWGIESVNLKLKKRHPQDSNYNTYKVDELERVLDAATGEINVIYPTKEESGNTAL